MADKIRVKRGNKANLPVLDDGEFGLVEDTSPKEVYIGTTAGNQKLVSAAPVSAVWTTPTLLNGWVNLGAPFNPAGYYKDDMNIVRLRGLIKSGTMASNTVLLTLPAGYRPLNNFILTAVRNDASSNLAVVAIEVRVSGDVTLNAALTANAWLTLDDLSFRAEQ